MTSIMIVLTKRRRSVQKRTNGDVMDVNMYKGINESFISVDIKVIFWIKSLGSAFKYTHIYHFSNCHLSSNNAQK